MAIEKCINEYDVDDVIFEEGSTGRELFVVLEGKIDMPVPRSSMAPVPWWKAWK